MLYFTCSMISRVELAHYKVSRAKVAVSVDCGTNVSYFLLDDPWMTVITCLLIYDYNHFYLRPSQGLEKWSGYIFSSAEETEEHCRGKPLYMCVWMGGVGACRENSPESQSS